MVTPSSSIGSGTTIALSRRHAVRLQRELLAPDAHRRLRGVRRPFAASDPDGDAVTRNQLWDSTTNFEINGAVQAAGDVIEVLASELDQVTFVAGSEVGASDHVSVRAFDGRQWSDWTGLWITQF